jgi:RNA polymerase sigma factor (sigma-70 family)
VSDSVLILRKALIDAISEFPENEREVISARFGIWSGKPQTIAEVRKAMGISRERVRQLEAKALRKLRAYPLAQKIVSQHLGMC